MLGFRVPLLLASLTAAIAPVSAHAQCRFPESGKTPRLIYRFQHESLPDGAVLHVTLESQADSTGRTELFIPKRWAGEELHGVVNLRALTPGVVIDTSADTRIAIVHAAAKQRVVVAYELTKDWTGALVNPRQFHAVVMPEYVEFTGSNALVRPSFGDGSSVTVHFDWQKLPESWALATSFGAGMTPSDRCQTFSGPSVDFFHALYAAGDFRLRHFRIGRQAAVLAVRGTWTFTDDEAVGQIQKVVGLVRDFWNDDNFPYFLVTLKPFDRDRGSSDGSAFTNAFWMYLSKQDSFAGLLPQLAHEAFHAWNPGRMGPLTADADKELGWFKEGFTSYYGALLVYRAGALPLASYVESVNRDLRQFPASNDVYVRGRVIALWLDGAIRRESAGRRSLDDVMFEMVRGAKQPLTLTRILEIVGRYLSPPARTLLERAVSDHGALAAPDELPFAGSCARASLQNLPTYDPGLDVARSRATSVITGVVPAGPAFAAGLRDGQTLVRISLSTGDPDRQALFTVHSADGDQQVAYFPRGPVVAGWQYAIIHATPCTAAAASALQQTQAPSDGLQVGAPVFRAGTVVVPVGLVLTYNGKPWIGLTASDFEILLDKKPIAPLDVAHDDQAQNHYTVFFQPPDGARDGKAHVVQVKVKRPNSKSWTTLPMKTSITLQKPGGAQRSHPLVRRFLR